MTTSPDLDEILELKKQAEKAEIFRAELYDAKKEIELWTSWAILNRQSLTPENTKELDAAVRDLASHLP